MIIHFKTHHIRFKNKNDPWGHKTLCGKKFHRGSPKLTNALMWVSCQTCLGELIGKKEKEIDYLKWALNDRKKLGELRNLSQTKGPSES